MPLWRGTMRPALAAALLSVFLSGTITSTHAFAPTSPVTLHGRSSELRAAACSSAARRVGPVVMSGAVKAPTTTQEAVSHYREQVLQEAAREAWLAPLEEEVKDFDGRLFAAPWGPEAVTPEDQEVFQYEKICTEGTLGPEAVRLCAALERDHYAVVRLPEGDAGVMRGMWEQAESFCALEDSTRFESAGRMRKVGEGMVGVLGYGQMPDGNAFLEMRVDEEGGMLPHGMDEYLPGFSDGMLACREVLTQVGKDVVEAVAAHSGIDGQGLLSLIDDGKELPPKIVSSTQHRLCHYTAEADVPFEAHTDTTFVTLIPRSSVPGLQVLAGEKGWVRPDAVATPAGVDASRDVIVMPGEFLQLLTGGGFKAAVHRVTRTDAANPRKSMPLLMRGRMWKTVDAGELLPSSGSPQGRRQGKVLSLHGAGMGQLHAYLSNPPQNRA